MKPWRDAATLIVSTRVAAGLRSEPHSKESATRNKAEDYRVLLLKRSQSNKFMPARLVFPGGVSHEVDHSMDWCRVYNHINIKCNYIAEQLKGSGLRPPMISAERSATSIAPDIAFRICAIRETFEESGLLLCSSRADCARVGLGPWAWSKDHLKIDHGVMNNWRQRVQKDATQFLTMCSELGIVPNVWALTEWRNWLTPAADGLIGEINKLNKSKMQGGNKKDASSEKKKIEGIGDAKKPRDALLPRRFDTMFYLCCMDVGDKLPYTASDNQETLTAEWFRPSELLDLSSPDNPEAGRPHLAPPQLYELSNLRRYSDLDSLYRHAIECGSRGTERWIPSFRKCTNGFIALLPGDQLYPVSADHESNQEYIDHLLAAPTESVEDLTKHSLPLNRMIFNDSTMRAGTVLWNCSI